MGMKPWKKCSVKIGLPNFVVVIFQWKIHNDLALQLKLMRPIIKTVKMVIAQQWDCREAQCIADMLSKKLKQLGYVKKLDLWIPHQLKEIHLTQRISIFWYATKLIHFWNAWSLATKRVFFITTLIGKDRGWYNPDDTKSWDSPKKDYAVSLVRL